MNRKMYSVLISLIIIFVISCRKDKNSNEEKKYDIKYHIDETDYFSDSNGIKTRKFYEFKIDTVNHTGYIIGWIPDSKSNYPYFKTLILDSVNAIQIVYTDPLGVPFDSNYVKINICKYVLDIWDDSTIVPKTYDCKSYKGCFLQLYTKKESKYRRGFFLH